MKTRKIIHPIFGEMEEITLEPGFTVLCDACNEDYTNSDECGGLLFNSYAICPKCVPKWEANAVKFNETKFIRDRAHPEESFRNFVYRHR